MSKRTIVFISVLASLIVAAGLGVLIWWLVRAEDDYTITRLENDGLGNVPFTAAITKVAGRGDMFWWFYPSLAAEPTLKPTIFWLHGVTGDSPSFLANFGMSGPYDINQNRREDSLVNDYNLLFVDAPLGTGFSTADSNSNTFPGLDENLDLLVTTLQSFYDLHDAYRDSPLYLLGQGDGSQLAVPLALRLSKDTSVTRNLKGLLLGNAVISPALALTKLGFYLEELAYIDGNGRNATESYANLINTLVENGEFEDAFDQFASLGEFVDENAGAVAVNLGHIVEKLTRNSSRDYFGKRCYLRTVYPDIDPYTYMQHVIGPALGMPTTVQFDGERELAIQEFKSFYMKPITDKVEDLLENTNVKVVIYNGNLDAVSNTPGQLEWVENLQWSGQENFMTKLRVTLVVNRVIEGYFREADSLQFYWINVAGHWMELGGRFYIYVVRAPGVVLLYASMCEVIKYTATRTFNLPHYIVPLDNPVGMKRMLDRVTNSTA